MSRVLIGDEDRELRELLADYLSFEGLQVEQVYDGTCRLERNGDLQELAIRGQRLA